MNRYPLWKNLLIGLVLLWGLIYTLPNFYGEVPAVQVSSAKATLKLDAAGRDRPSRKRSRPPASSTTGIFSDSTACAPASRTPTPS
jgi:preprotein translocase subunit SecD